MERVLGIALTAARLAAAPAGAARFRRAAGRKGRRGRSARDAAVRARLRPTRAPASRAHRTARCCDGPFPQGGLVRAVSDGGLLESADPETRELALARIRATGATVVRIPVDWQRTASPPARRAGFDADRPRQIAPTTSAASTKPSAARSRPGLRRLLVVSHAPAFAEAPRALAVRLSGQLGAEPGSAARRSRRRSPAATTAPFPTRGCPAARCRAVRYFQAWNEPNLPATWSRSG